MMDRHGSFAIIRPAIAAVVVPCASRKRLGPPADLTASALHVGSQAQVADEWRARIDVARPRSTAAEMYMGRGFKIGLSTAETSGGRLFVVSAGLGLVASDRMIPSYGLTVSGRGPECVRQAIDGVFSLDAWWQALAYLTFAATWDEVLGRPGLVLMALSQSYAALISADLMALDAASRSRLRIFGKGVADVLSAPLRAQVMPYDERLDAAIPGTQTDFAQRALAHFASRVADLSCADAAADAAAVLRALAVFDVPVRVRRPRVGDDQLLSVIRRHLRTTRGIGRLLGRLRQEDGLACEQRRFTRLYRVAERSEVVR